MFAETNIILSYARHKIWVKSPTISSPSLSFFPDLVISDLQVNRCNLNKYILLCIKTNHLFQILGKTQSTYTEPDIIDSSVSIPTPLSHSHPQMSNHPQRMDLTSITQSEIAYCLYLFILALWLWITHICVEILQILSSL
jgi:hypothetical protein